MTSKNTFFLGILILVNQIAIGQSDTVFLKSFGGAFFEEASEVIQRSGGGYTVLGTTGSNETGSTDVFVASFDEDLNCLWNRNYGNSDAEWGLGIVEDLSGNFLVCGYTLSTGVGSYDMLAMKINAQGDLMWQQTFGGDDWDFARKIIPHPLGGFLICGSTYSDGNGDQDGVVLHIDGQGVLLNQWFIGGSGKDACADIMLLEDGWLAGGYQTISDTMIATIWKFNLLGNIEWVRTLDDPNGFDRSLSALSTANDFIFGTGQVYSDEGIKSFEARLPLDNSSVLDVVEVQQFEFIYNDCVSVNDRIVFVGSKIDNAIEVGRVVRKHADLYFTGVFEFTGQHKAKFNSVLWPNDELVMCGSFQPTPSQNWQAVLLRYTSPNMTEIWIEPDPVPCFSVGIEESETPSLGEAGVLFNVMGQIVNDHYEWGNEMSRNLLPQGVYIFQSEAKRAFTFRAD